MSSPADVEVALDAIERHEARFLAWGILDNALTLEEVEGVLHRDGLGDAGALVTELRKRFLLFEVPRSSPPTYRTRMAEGVRLFAGLRQQFESRSWEQAAPLVGDFRFLVRPRWFPERSLTHAQVKDRLGGANLAAKAQSALKALLAGGDGLHERRLSRFQVEASGEIMRGLGANGDQGCIVTAGTGSGKTLAFYLPTILHLVADRNLGKGALVLAVYPRNELLKDQLVATLRELRRVRASDPTLPVIRIGAYFGLTPMKADARPLPDYLGWHRPRGSSALVCPFLVCPGLPNGKDCGDALLWEDKDRKSGIERLVCRSCEATVASDEFAVTRNGMQAAPPDILFTTTEMLNRSLTDDWSGHVFGVGPRVKTRTRLVLLDEVHTYSGPSGAQAAYLLRRWRHLAGGPITWVGLSATLRDAEQFFSKLTGVPADFVREVTPLSEDLVRRGHEYQLLLRGDPTSQAALLSTSIQTLMLLVRLLDPLGKDLSLGAFGQKVFAFSDNLDLTNRLYRQLLDAEGRDPVGKIDENDIPLARLRSEVFHPGGSGIVDWRERDQAGQQWWLVDRLRDVPTPPIVGRTSSQDSGVQADASTIIATASLEVGFDDPTVGAVLQHKAPRDLAQFVQRRGRAGRTQSMRPWTVVVLSDYGRDRQSYQSYERLLDPTLPPKVLPLGNRSVQRMQATFAAMDWAADVLRRRGASRGTVRRELSQPNPKWQERQSALCNLLKEVLEDQTRLDELSTFLQKSLRLSPEEVDILLWEGPRSVLLEAIPTAVRRLESKWQLVKDGKVIDGGDAQRRDHPLPEYVPSNLFSDLCLPEIDIAPPDGYDKAASTEEPVFLALGQLAPGNVTLRYAVWKTRGLWVDPGNASGRLDVSMTFLEGAEAVAQVKNVTGDLVDVMRPYSVSPAVAPGEVQTTSRGQFNWEVLVTPAPGAIEAEVPQSGGWTELIGTTQFYLQAARGGIRMLRYTFGGVADVGRRTGERDRIRYELANGDRPVALGIELDVDAMLLTVRPPADIAGFALDRDPRRLRQLRRDYFLWLVEEALGEAEGLNVFLAQWLGELTVAAAALAIMPDGGSDPPKQWSESDWSTRILEAFDRAFQGLHDDNDDGVDEPRLRVAVRGAVERAWVRDELGRLFDLASEPPSAGWYEWLRSRFVVTAAAAVHSAIQAVLPDFDADADLTVDLVDQGVEAQVWISDASVGGGGLIEMLYRVYSEDPRRFWQLARGALEPAESEQALDLLRRVVSDLVEGTLGPVAEGFRTARGDDSVLQATQKLTRAMSESGIPPSHALFVAMMTRLLRPGSSAASDRAVHTALKAWEKDEEQLGFALDQRTASALAARNPQIIKELGQAAPQAARVGSEAWAFNVLLNLLWAPAEQVRPFALQPPMPFMRKAPHSERTLVLDALPDAEAAVDVASPNWRTELNDLLADSGRCVLLAPPGSEAELSAGLLSVMAEPVEVGSLHLHPRVVGVRRQADSVGVVLELVEAPQ